MLLLGGVMWKRLDSAIAFVTAAAAIDTIGCHREAQVGG